MLRITPDWCVEIDATYEKWIEDGSLVFAKAGRTIWIDCWGDGDEPSREEIIALVKSEASPDRDDLFESDDEEVYRYAYRLVEFEDGARRFAVYAFAVVEGSYLQVAIYFDDPKDKPWSDTFARSLAYLPVEPEEFAAEEE